MNISRKEIQNIINSQLQIIAEERETFSSEEASEEAKTALISSEYLSRIYNSILNNVKASPDDKIVSPFIEKYTSTPDYQKLINNLASLASTNPKILLIKKRIDAINRLILYFLQELKKVENDPTKLTKMIDLKKEFVKHAINLKKFLEDAVLQTRQLFNYSGTSGDTGPEGTRKNLTSKSVEAIVSLEKISFLYLSELESLFQKFLSIKTDNEQYNKKWSEFTALEPQTLARDVYKQQQDFKNKGLNYPKDKTDQFFKLSGGAFSGPTGNPTFETPIKEFDLKSFIGALYKKKFDINSLEVKKAKSINTSIESIYVYDTDKIPNTFKQVDKDLWNTKTKKYIFDSHIRKIFFDLKSAKNESRNVLYTLLKKMEEANRTNISSVDFFKSNFILIDAFVKRIQFFKISIKNAFMKIISHDKAEIDEPLASKDISKQQEEKVQKRLHYWNLFKKLGWTEEDAPDYLYK